MESQTTATRQEQRFWSFLAALIKSPSTPLPLPCVSILRCHLLVFLGGLIGGAELGANFH